ncbi:tetraspanin-7-like [Chelonus insularis]|uniref:tetraspanin-7-like n=1 Tax=Chelonus insularis TaxID=460826 RepID=UPI00158BFF73|nr:tetraspanin-7-like [Chelonus insularis]XP_034939610.1 tetraspanin-7-like [Chelonus insularis]
MGKRFETMAAMACMTTLLMLFNFIFWCTGIAMLYVGIWMRIQLREYVDMSVEGSGAALLGLACLGALVVLAATLACCCTARGRPALLYLYGAFLAVVALLELGAGASVYAYRTTLVEGFDQGLNESLAAYGTDQAMSNHIDAMQSTLHCCGNRAYTDWLDLKPPKKVPESCCKPDLEVCNVNDVNNIYEEGCYKRVIDFINSNVSLVAGSAVGVAFFPLIGVFLACCLASNINKAKYEQVA